MKTLVSVLALVGLCSLASLAALTPAQNPGTGAEVKMLKGRLVKVSDDGKTVTVETGYGEKTTTIAVAVDDKTVVTIDGKDAKVADLKAPMFVTVIPAEGTATKIEAEIVRPIPPQPQ